MRLFNPARYSSRLSSSPTSTPAFRAVFKSLHPANSTAQHMSNGHALAAMAELAYKNSSHGNENHHDILDLEQLDAQKEEAYHFLDSNTSIFSSSTQAIVLSNKDHIVISFRGTQYDLHRDPRSVIYDWTATNFNIRETGVTANLSNALVHEGFQKALTAIWDNQTEATSLLSVLDKCRHENKQLWFTGHSLGAALATLAAARLLAEGAATIEQVGGVYTYGSPMIGNTVFKDVYTALGLDGKTIRVANNNDMVTFAPYFHPHAEHAVPDALSGLARLARLLAGVETSSSYRHVGKLYYITHDGDIVIEPTEQELEESYLIGIDEAGKSDLILDHRHKLYYNAMKQGNQEHNGESACSEIFDVTDPFMSIPSNLFAR